MERDGVQVGAPHGSRPLPALASSVSLEHHAPPSRSLCSFSRFPVGRHLSHGSSPSSTSKARSQPRSRSSGTSLTIRGPQLPSFPSVGLVMAHYPLPISRSLGSKGDGVSGSLQCHQPRAWVTCWTNTCENVLAPPALPSSWPCSPEP